MATWTVPAALLAVCGGGDVLRLRVDLGGVLLDRECRLCCPGAPHEPLRVSPGARAWAERAVPPASRVWFVSEGRDRWCRPMGRLFYGRGTHRDLALGLLEAGLAAPARRVAPGYARETPPAGSRAHPVGPA